MTLLPRLHGETLHVRRARGQGSLLTLFWRECLIGVHLLAKSFHEAFPRMAGQLNRRVTACTDQTADAAPLRLFASIHAVNASNALTLAVKTLIGSSR